MEHLMELGPESIQENQGNDVYKENTRFWFGATWDSERNHYSNDVTGEKVDFIADGIDSVEFGVLLRTIFNTWSF